MGFTSGSLASKARLSDGVRTTSDVFLDSFSKVVAIIDFLSSGFFTNLRDAKEPKEREAVLIKGFAHFATIFGISIVCLDGTTPACKRKLGKNGVLVELQAFIQKKLATPEERGPMFVAFQDFASLMRSGAWERRDGQGVIVIAQGLGEADIAMGLIQRALEKIDIKPLGIFGVSLNQAKDDRNSNIHPCLKPPYTEIDPETVSEVNPYSPEDVELFAETATNFPAVMKSLLCPNDEWRYVCFSSDGDATRNVTHGVVIEKIYKNDFGYKVFMYSVERFYKELGEAAFLLAEKFLNAESNKPGEISEIAKKRKEEMTGRIEKDGRLKELERLIGAALMADGLLGDPRGHAKESEFKEPVKKPKPETEKRSTRSSSKRKVGSVPVPVVVVEEEPVVEPIEADNEDEDEELPRTQDGKPNPTSSTSFFKALILYDLSLEELSKTVLDSRPRSGTYIHATEGSTVGFFRSAVAILMAAGFPAPFLPDVILDEVGSPRNSEMMEEKFEVFQVQFPGSELFRHQLYKYDWEKNGFNYKTDFGKPIQEWKSKSEGMDVDSGVNIASIAANSQPAESYSDADAFDLLVRAGLIFEEGFSSYPGSDVDGGEGLGVSGCFLVTPFYTIPTDGTRESSEASTNGKKSKRKAQDDYKSGFGPFPPASGYDYNSDTMHETFRYIEKSNEAQKRDKDDLEAGLTKLVDRLVKLGVKELGELNVDEVNKSIERGNESIKFVQAVDSILLFLEDVIQPDKKTWSSTLFKQVIKKDKGMQAVLLFYTRRVFRALNVEELEVLTAIADTPTNRLVAIRDLDKNEGQIPLLLQCSPKFLSLFLTGDITRENENGYRIKTILQHPKWKLDMLKYDFVESEKKKGEVFEPFCFACGLMYEKESEGLSTLEKKLQAFKQMAKDRKEPILPGGIPYIHSDSTDPNVLSEYWYERLLKEKQASLLPNFGKSKSVVKIYASFAIYIAITEDMTDEEVEEVFGAIDWDGMVDSVEGKMKAGDLIRYYLSVQGRKELSEAPLNQQTIGQGLPGGKTIRIMTGGKQKKVKSTSLIGLDKKFPGAILYLPRASPSPSPSQDSRFENEAEDEVSPTAIALDSSKMDVDSPLAASKPIQFLPSEISGAYQDKLVQIDGKYPYTLFKILIHDKPFYMSEGISKDGDCLFTCMAAHLTVRGEVVTAAEVRAKIIALVRNNPTDYQDFFGAKDESMPALDPVPVLKLKEPFKIKSKGKIPVYKTRTKPKGSKKYAKKLMEAMVLAREKKAQAKAIHEAGFNNDTSLESWIAKMSQPGYYGDSRAIRLIAEAYNCRIAVLGPGYWQAFKPEHLPAIAGPDELYYGIAYLDQELHFELIGS